MISIYSSLGRLSNVEVRKERRKKFHEIMQIRFGFGMNRLQGQIPYKMGSELRKGLVTSLVE